MLTILIGRAKTGKSDTILRRMAELGESSQQILLVPEHASHQAEVDVCRACGDTASRHAEVLSFRRLGERVLSITGGIADVTLDNGGKLLTLQRALLETAPQMTVYRKPSQKVGFLEQMLALFDELRSYEVTPEILYQQAQDIDGATHDKLTDLSLLYAAYEARLRRPGLDARDRMTKLCDHLEESGYVRGKVQILEGDALRLGIFQSLQRLLHLRHTLIFGIVTHPCLYAFRFLYDISGDETVFDFVTGHERIVVDAPLQGSEQILRRAVGYLPHIVEIDRTIFVERRRQGFFGRAYVGMALHREGNRMLEDVRLDELSVFHPFQRKDVAPARIHHH